MSETDIVRAWCACLLLVGVRRINCSAISWSVASVQNEVVCDHPAAHTFAGLRCTSTRALRRAGLVLVSQTRTVSMSLKGGHRSEVVWSSQSHYTISWGCRSRRKYKAGRVNVSTNDIQFTALWTIDVRTICD